MIQLFGFCATTVELLRYAGNGRELYIDTLDFLWLNVAFYMFRDIFCAAELFFIISKNCSPPFSIPQNLFMIVASVKEGDLSSFFSPLPETKSKHFSPFAYLILMTQINVFVYVISHTES